MTTLDAVALGSLALLVAVWGVYPLVIGALARLRAEVSEPLDEQPMVSVVLATRDDDEAVNARIADLLRADYYARKLEIIVAFDRTGAPRAERRIRNSWENIKFVDGDAPGGKAATLNAAVRSARGDILVFADAQQKFEPTAIRYLVAAFHDARVAAVSGALEIGSGGEPTPIERYWRMERALRRAEARLHSCIGVTGAIWAMRRAEWMPLPAGLILDDVYTPMRLVLAGHRIGFAERAHASDLRSSQAEQEYARKVRTLTGVVQLCAWQPRVLVPIVNPVWAQFVMHKLMRLLTPYWVLAIGVWVAVRGGQWLWQHPVAAAVLGGLAVVGALVGGQRAARKVGHLIKWGALLQAAVVVATVNGMRGRWDVWR